MRTRRLPLLRVFLASVLLTMAADAAPVRAQLGGLGAAARRAQEELRKRREAEEQEKKEAPQPAAPATQPPAAAAAPAADTAPAFQAFSKFDFVPGEKVVALDDFTQDAVGDFPARWNTNASGEIVTVTGRSGHWLKLAGTGFYLPEFVNALPDDFTLEFDVLTPPVFSGYPLNAVIADLPSSGAAGWTAATNSVILRLQPGSADTGTSGAPAG